MTFILASKSPRRKELFSKITENFEVMDADIDERRINISAPDKLCIQLATLKCREVFSAHPDCCVIGCDTMVSADGKLLGKPSDKNQELEMLNLLSGREHDVYTGVCIMAPGIEKSFCCRTGVSFRTLSPREMEEYASSSEPYDKAGGYGIQDTASKFCRSINGDYFNVMGLPVCELYSNLTELGLL